MSRTKASRRSKAERELLDAARTLAHERRRARDDDRRAAADFMERQHKASAAFHRKIVDRALGAIGIDEETLGRRHERERASALKFLAGRKRSAVAAAAAANRAHTARHDEALGRRRSHHAPPPPGSAPSSEVAILTSATTIDLDARQGGSSIAPEQNVVKTKAEQWGWVSAATFDLRGDIALASWNFLWQPPWDGSLNVISALEMNGWGAAYPGPGCVKGSSSWRLDAGVRITQLAANGTPFTDSSEGMVAHENFGSDDVPSTGGAIITGRRLDGVENLFYNTLFPVVSQTPVLVTVTAQLSVLVAHGEAELDFMDGDFQLNVPYVYLLLYR